MIKGLHHNAYRCRNSEETRGFYEDFLGLRFVSAFEIDEGRGLHSFFEMDGTGPVLHFLRFRENRSTSNDRTHSTFTSPSASSPTHSTACWTRHRDEEVEVRGPVDHGFVRSIYMCDPNGYVVELTATTGVRQEIMDPTVSKPHEALARWQAAKTSGQPGQSSAA